MVLGVPSVKKQADDARRLAKLLGRIETNRKAREAKSAKENFKIDAAAS
jgi:hypothetical protein